MPRQRFDVVLLAEDAGDTTFSVDSAVSVDFAVSDGEVDWGNVFTIAVLGGAYGCSWKRFR